MEIMNAAVKMVTLEMVYIVTREIQHQHAIVSTADVVVTLRDVKTMMDHCHAFVLMELGAMDSIAKLVIGMMNATKNLVEDVTRMPCAMWYKGDVLAGARRAIWETVFIVNDSLILKEKKNAKLGA